MPPHPAPARYKLTGDTTCRPGCIHYGLPGAPPHSHWEQADPPPAERRENWWWRALFRLYGDATPTQ